MSNFTLLSDKKYARIGALVTINAWWLLFGILKATNEKRSLLIPIESSHFWQVFGNILLESMVAGVAGATVGLLSKKCIKKTTNLAEEQDMPLLTGIREKAILPRTSKALVVGAFVAVEAWWLAFGTVCAADKCSRMLVNLSHNHFWQVFGNILLETGIASSVGAVFSYAGISLLRHHGYTEKPLPPAMRPELA